MDSHLFLREADLGLCHQLRKALGLFSYSVLQFSGLGRKTVVTSPPRGGWAITLSPPSLECTFIVLDAEKWQVRPSTTEDSCMAGDVNLFLTDLGDPSLGEIEVMIAGSFHLALPSLPSGPWSCGTLSQLRLRGALSSVAGSALGSPWGTLPPGTPVACQSTRGRLLYSGLLLRGEFNLRFQESSDFILPHPCWGAGHWGPSQKKGPSLELLPMLREELL